MRVHRQRAARTPAARADRITASRRTAATADRTVPERAVPGAEASRRAASTAASSLGRRTSVLLAVLALIFLPRTSSAQSASVANAAVRTLPSWLDDAEVI